MDRPDPSADPAPLAPRVPRRLTSAGEAEPVKEAASSFKPTRPPFGAAGARMAPEATLGEPLATGSRLPEDSHSARMLLINILAALLIGALVGAAAMLEAIGPRPAARPEAVVTGPAAAPDPAPVDATPAVSAAASRTALPMQGEAVWQAPISDALASVDAAAASVPPDRMQVAVEDDDSDAASEAASSEPSLPPGVPAAGAVAPQRSAAPGSSRGNGEAAAPRRSESAVRTARQTVQSRSVDPYCRAKDGLALAQCRQCDHMGAIPRGFCENRVRLTYCSGRYGRLADCPLPVVASPN